MLPQRRPSWQWIWQSPSSNSLSPMPLGECSGVRRFHVGTGHFEPTHDAGYTTAGLLVLPQLSINPLLYGGVHIRKVSAHWLSEPC